MDFTNAAKPLIASDGEASQYVAEPLHRAIHNSKGSSYNPDVEGVEQGSTSHRKWDHRPWHKRPSPWWILPMISFSAFIYASTMASRTQIYIQLACQQLRPNLFYETVPTLAFFKVVSSPTLSTIPQLPMAQQEPRLQTPTTSELGEGRPKKPLVALNGPATMLSTDPRCSSDLEIQAAVARLVTVMTLITGALTCVTAGWWGQLSDTYGRTRVLVFTTLGVIISESNLILVYFVRGRLPGGYWFLVFPSMLDGLFGGIVFELRANVAFSLRTLLPISGIATASATAHAYIADCTEPHARSRFFSMYLGILYIGLAAGPSFGSVVISYSQDLLSVFYLAVAIHILGGIVFFTIIPESIGPDTVRRLANKRDQQERERQRCFRRNENHPGFVARKLLGLLGFLKPLAIFLPKKRGDPHSKRDWNLINLITGWGIMVSYMCLYHFKAQYAIATFRWTTEELGYWLSIVGFSRAFHLIVILPAISKVFKPAQSPIQLPHEHSGPLVSQAVSTAPNSSLHQPKTGISPRMIAQYDIRVARISLTIELFSYICLALSTSSVGFTASSVLGSFGGGLTPSIQSLALFLTTDDSYEAGKVFGAMSMVQALGSQIVGPVLFGSVYINTIATHPTVFIIVAGAGSIVALLMLLLIRLPDVPKPNREADTSPDHESDPLL